MARNIAVGVGLMEFPFSSTDGFWRWVDLCEAGGIDSIWQTDRIVSRQPILECMTALAAIAGPHAADQVRRERGVAGVARSGAAGEAMRDDRCAVAGQAAAGVRHRQSAGAGVADAAHRHRDARAQDR